MKGRGAARGWWASTFGYVLTIVGVAVILYNVITVGGVTSIPANTVTYAGVGVVVFGVALAAVGIERGRPEEG
jgi:hypothetical protein